MIKYQLLLIAIIITILSYGCQRNYYLIEEAYYQGNYLKTITLINQLSDHFPKQITKFFSHSEKRLAEKLIDTATLYGRTSDFHMLCYIHKLLPELIQIQAITSSTHFQNTYNQLYQRYTTLLPSFLDNEKKLGEMAFKNQDYFLAIARFNRYLHFQKNTTITSSLEYATARASLHLTISPFKIPVNQEQIVFGIPISPYLLNTLTTQIKKKPIPFIAVDTTNKNTPETYTLSGNIIAHYKDTQMIPEQQTIKDTLRYQHDIGGILQWDTYEFEYTIEKVEFTVSLDGDFTLTDSRGHTHSFTVKTRYGQDSQYRKEALTLPHEYYKIEFPIGYTKILDVPLLLDQPEIVKQAIMMFSNDIYDQIKIRFKDITSTGLTSICPY